MQKRYMIFIVIFSVKSFFLAAKTNVREILIEDPSKRRLKVAVPVFSVEKSLGNRLARLTTEGLVELENLLKYTKSFDLVSREAYHGFKYSSSTKHPLSNEFGKIDFKLLKNVGVEALVTVHFFTHTKGFRVEFRTADLNQMSRVVGKAYIIKTVDDFIEVSKRYIDHILQAYTGKALFSSKIAFVGKATLSSYPQIYVCDIDGRNLKQLTYGNYLHMSPSIGPEGQVLYTSYKNGKPDLYMYKNNKSVLVEDNHNLNSGGVFSPDAKFVVYSGSQGRSTDLFAINQQTLKKSMLTVNSSMNVDPIFSPDGKWLAFASGRYGNPHIFRAKVKNGTRVNQLQIGDPQRLTYVGWYNTTPAWSPSSKKIAFSSYEKGGTFDIFIMNADGSNLERLTLGPGDNESPAWTANGQLIVFHSNRIKGRSVKAGYQLYIMDKEGKEQVQIQTGLYEAKSPHLF